MARISPFIFFCVTSVLSGAASVSDMCRGAPCFPAQDRSRPCVGAHCQGRTEAAASRRQFHQSAQPRQGQVYPHHQKEPHFSYHQAPLAPYTVIQPQQGGFAQQTGADGTRRTNPRTITAEVFHPGCAGGTCQTTVSRRQPSDDSAAGECKGIGCKLPLRMRQKSKPCAGDGCDAHGGEHRRGGSSPEHMRDRAAQFLEELPDYGSEPGAWIQLTCDMKPGQ